MLSRIHPADHQFTWVQNDLSQNSYEKLAVSDSDFGNLQKHWTRKSQHRSLNGNGGMPETEPHGKYLRRVCINLHGVVIFQKQI